MANWKSGARQSIVEMCPNGLTLVEVMVATAILSIGLVLVVRSWLTAVAALDTAQHRIKAIQFLETKLTHLTLQAQEPAGIQPGSHEEPVALNRRVASWKLDVEPVSAEELTQGEASTPGTEDQPGASESRSHEVDVVKVQMSLSWREGRRGQEVVLATYLPYTPPQQEPE